MVTKKEKDKQREEMPFIQRKLMLESHLENLLSEFQKDTGVEIYGIETDVLKVKNYFKKIMVKVVVK